MIIEKTGRSCPASSVASEDPSLMALSPTFLETHKLVVHSGDKIPADESASKPVREADQAPRKRHSVSDEEPTQGGEDEPVGDDEHPEPHHNPSDNTLDSDVQARKGLSTISSLSVGVKGADCSSTYPLRHFSCKS